MALDVKMSVRKEINRLKKSITQKSSDLVSLKDDLRKHERVYKLIAGGRTWERSKLWINKKRIC